MLTDAERDALDEQGFLLLEGFMGDDLLAALRGRVEELFAAEGENAGAEFKQEAGCRRLANLVNKGEIFRSLIAVPKILACAGHVIGAEFKLSSLNARSADARANVRQPLHADMGAVADEKGYWVFNTVWMLDDFTATNGSIRAVPGSHRIGKLPQEALDDPLAPHPDEVLLTGTAGSVMVMNAHLWHGATANETSRPRRAVHVFYSRRDKPQQQYQKALLSAEVQASLSTELRQVLALDDPLNDRLSTEEPQRSGFLK